MTLPERWKLIEASLRQARAKLLAHGTCGLEEAEEFLHHNEWELAWDVLARLAREENAGPECWRHLADAAGMMNLPEKQAHALERAAVGAHA